MNIIAQIIGLIAITTWLISVKQTTKKKLAKYQTISNFLYAIQYFLLNAYSAASMNILSFIRCYIMYDDLKHKRKTTKNLIIISTLLMIIIGIFTYNGIISIIPIIITIAYSIALYQKKIVYNYYTVIIAAVIWILYNYIIGAYISVIGNIFEILFGINSLKKYYKKTNK